METDDQLLKIKDLIFDLSKEQQEKIMQHHEYLNEYLYEHGEDAFIALALLMAEISND